MPEEITAQEAAAIIHIDVSQVQRLCRNKILAARFIGTGRRKTYFVSREAAEAYRDRPTTRGWRRGRERPGQRKPAPEGDGAGE